MDYFPIVELELRAGDRACVLRVRMPSAKTFSQFLRRGESEDFDAVMARQVKFVSEHVTGIDGGDLFGRDYSWPESVEERRSELHERWPALAVARVCGAIVAAVSGGAADEGKYECGPRSSRVTGTGATTAPTT